MAYEMAHVMTVRWINHCGMLILKIEYFHTGLEIGEERKRCLFTIEQKLQNWKFYI